MIKLRLIENDTGKWLLSFDGTMIKADNLLLDRLFLNFKTPDIFKDFPESWMKKAKLIENVQGKTLATVDEKNHLVVWENTAFNELLLGFHPDAYLTLKEYAEEQGKSISVIKTLCQNNKIAGAVKKGGVWFIPKTSPYPRDKK